MFVTGCPAVAGMTTVRNSHVLWRLELTSRGLIVGSNLCVAESATEAVFRARRFIIAHVCKPNKTEGLGKVPTAGQAHRMRTDSS